MIYIEYSEKDNARELCVKGHANSNEHGKDMICCAVSTLAQTLAFYLEYEKMDREIHDEEGYLYIMSEDDKAEKCFDMTILGLISLQNQFKDYISFKQV